MNKTVLVSLLLLLLSMSLSAHAVLLVAEIENDTTLYIEAGLSTGKTPAGAKIVLKEKATGRPLWEGQIPEEGGVNAPLPTTPYTVSVVLSAGHEVTKSGPLPEKKEAPKQEELKEAEETTTENKQSTNPEVKKSLNIVSDSPQSEEDKKGIPTVLITVLCLLAGALFGFFQRFKRK